MEFTLNRGAAESSSSPRSSSRPFGDVRMPRGLISCIQSWPFPPPTARHHDGSSPAESPSPPQGAKATERAWHGSLVSANGFQIPRRVPSQPFLFEPAPSWTEKMHTLPLACAVATISSSSETSSARTVLLERHDPQQSVLSADVQPPGRVERQARREDRRHPGQGALERRHVPQPAQLAALQPVQLHPALPPRARHDSGRAHGHGQHASPVVVAVEVLPQPLVQTVGHRVATGRVRAPGHAEHPLGLDVGHADRSVGAPARDAGVGARGDAADPVEFQFVVVALRSERRRRRRRRAFLLPSVELLVDREGREGLRAPRPPPLQEPSRRFGEKFPPLPNSPWNSSLPDPSEDERGGDVRGGCREERRAEEVRRAGATNDVAAAAEASAQDDAARAPTASDSSGALARGFAVATAVDLIADL
ncbi:hypothetical protein ACHAWF_011670 [Thalassiosira exigua]